ncbi:hypothetical protein [Sphingobium sp. Z007]|uniref:hypothetical protein n=1 Tax=Sphingobium sp. Z007 TaxID=627495 RepID=UPI000B4A3B00|nr:hypothetical protein [Sphingobium sp. Z007]
MTDNTNSVAIAADIEILRSNLAKVHAMIDLIGKPAITAAEQISNALETAKRKFDDAISREATEQRLARLAGFRDVRVSYPLDAESLLRTPFTIIYTKETWDVKLGMSVPKEHAVSGFGMLDVDAYEYLMTVRPDAIPTEIKALVPDDPQAAMSTYLLAHARGYFKGKTA